MKNFLKAIRNWPFLNGLLRSLVRSFRTRVEKGYQWFSGHWPVSGIVTIGSGKHSYRIFSNSDDYIAKKAYFGIGYEPGTDNFLEVAVHQSHLLFDVGGNTGHFSLAACAMNPALKAVAFEPVPSIFKRLEKNIGLNNFSIRPENIALSDNNGSMSLFVPTAEISYSASSNAQFHLTNVAEVKIPALTMDEYVKRNGGSPDLIKIDVEWHEMGVLKGAIETLKSSSPVLVIEVLFAEIEVSKNALLEGRLSATHAKSIEDFMREQGYHFYKPLPSGLMRIDSLEPNYDERNYIFSKKKSKRQFISYMEPALLISEIFQ